MTSPIGALATVFGLWITLSVLCVSGSSQQIHKVEYIVNGVNHASLTYASQNGDTEQIGKQSLPWTKTINVRDGAFLYISAQNQDDNGSIHTEIWIDGKEAKENTSSGAYVIATSSLRCCD